MKQCTVCLMLKPFSEFSPDRRVSSGVQSRCKSCYAKIMRERREENPDRHRAAVKKSTSKNYEKKLQRNNRYRSCNPEKVSEWKRRDRLNNYARIQADNAKRRTLVDTTITPETKQIYALRDFYRAMSLGEDFHVDHIIPVSKGGLHEASNLQVIPAIDNLRKGANIYFGGRTLEKIVGLRESKK